MWAWSYRYMKLEDLKERILDYTYEQRRALIVISLAAIAIATFFFSQTRGEAIEMTAPTPAISLQPSSAATPQNGLIYIHVAGKVMRPGLYTLMKGARVADAISAAGGAKKSEDLSEINLARILSDGEQVYVGTTPTQYMPSAKGSKKQRYTGIININRASVGELDSLPGIGPVLASRIIEYRKVHGPFATLDELRKVRGIGAALFDDIKGRLSL